MCGADGNAPAPHDAIEEIQRPAASQPPPDLASLFSSILGGGGHGSGGEAGGGNATPAAPAGMHAAAGGGGGGGGLIGILQSPAFQQMAGQLLNGPLGAGACLQRRGSAWLVEVGFAESSCWGRFR